MSPAAEPPRDDAHTPGGVADSAGVPWAGRRFHENPAAGDDGSADPALLAALRDFAAGSGAASVVLDALRGARLLIPLLAERGDEGVGAHGQLVDKTQELSIVTVAGPDGRDVLPAFTSVATMQAWDPVARPIPIEARRVALAAAGEGTDLVVIDARSETEFALRRPALRALATGEAWLPPHLDPAVEAALAEGAEGEEAVVAIGTGTGDPLSRLAGPELVIRLALVAGLDRAALDALLARLSDRWSASLADRVDALAVRLVQA